MTGQNTTSSPRLVRWTPRSPARTNLIIAALIWTAVGCGLAIAGIRWIVASSTSIVAILLVWIGVIIGGIKYRFAISKTGRRAAQRIITRGDGKCVGGLFSTQTWLFVLAMMIVGNVLRRLPIPLWLLGVIYWAVGLALAYGSMIYWREWRHQR